MLESLYKREIYGPAGALQIETLGSMAVAIANRWQLGWPEQVKALIKARLYLVNLDAQAEREMDVLADAGDLQHMADHEILQMHEIDAAPPVCETPKKAGASFAKEGNAIYPLPIFVTYAEPRTAEQIAYGEALRKRQETYSW